MQSDSRCGLTLALTGSSYGETGSRKATHPQAGRNIKPPDFTGNAQKYIFLNLSSSANGIEKRVIELDIEKCFDRINHSAIMDELIAPKGLKLGIFRCLKTGVNPEFPEQGTPQGGVVTPPTILQKLL